MRVGGGEALMLEHMHARLQRQQIGDDTVIAMPPLISAACAPASINVSAARFISSMLSTSRRVNKLASGRFGVTNKD